MKHVTTNNRVIPAEKLKVMDRAMEELIAMGLKESALRDGDRVDWRAGLIYRIFISI
jgi:hypothetical protein